MAEKKKEFNLADYLAPGDVSKSDTAAPQVELIDLDLIDGNDQNFYELSNLEPLADSIAMDGLQQPLVVTMSPEDPDRVVLISGHRRRAAIQQLVDDEETPRADLRKVPCIRREYASPEMAELQLIFANSTSRVLTSAEISRQAERVELLLYKLKESGFEFPGRMRDHVAEACNVSASKLARLKVIREKLEPEFMTVFETGALSEDAAYTIAKEMDTEMQRTVIEGRTAGKGPMGLDIPSGVASHIAESLTALMAKPAYDCPAGECNARPGQIRKITRMKYSWEHACRQCCLDCHERHSCSAACTAQKDKKAAAAELERKRQAKLEKERLQAQAETAKKNKEFARRLMDLSGGNVAELGEIDWQFAEKNIKKALDGEYQSYGMSQPYFGTAEKLADKFGVSLDYIYGRTTDPHPYDGEWRNAEVELPLEGDYVFVLTRGGVIYPSVFFRGKFMDYAERSVGNREISNVELWTPIPPLPEGYRFSGQETIAEITRKYEVKDDG